MSASSFGPRLHVAVKRNWKLAGFLSAGAILAMPLLLNAAAEPKQKLDARSDACIDNDCHSSNSSSLPCRIAALTSNSFNGGMEARHFRERATFSCGVSGAAAVINPRYVAKCTG